MRDTAAVDVSRVIPTVHPVMAALSRGIPITLLLDLAEPAGPDSRAVLSTEVADLSWLRDLAFPPSVAPSAADPSVSDRATG
jgi:hypothetical protein